MWRLLGIEGIHAGRWFEIAEDYTLIGTGERCDVRLEGDGCAAERQGEFILWSGECLYRDLDHRYISAVNGVEDTGIAKLRPGDTIRIGGTLFRMERVRRSRDAYVPGPLMRKVLNDEHFKEACRRGARPRRRGRGVWLWLLFAAVVLTGVVCLAGRRFGG
ncbi:MAG: FHA domain-containing protein [Armatimonadota bacterium]